MSKSGYIETFFNWLESRNSRQQEFIQAVKEVTNDIGSVLEETDYVIEENILYRLAEPDRLISFRVCWEDDHGNIRVNRGWRVQHCGAIGPYKGGIRFHPSVNESVLKFLAFEQTFKNALTGLAIGGGKGGSDFDPSGCSEREIMRFCQAFMNELYRHIGANTDVPAGDINVGSREIGFLFGHYRRLVNTFSGALTGKDLEFGGSHVRTEATGYGLIYFLREVLAADDGSLTGKRVAISVAGNVALHAAQKALQMEATVVTLSSSQGVLFIEQGFSADIIENLIDYHGDMTEKLSSLADELGGQWADQQKPWQFDCDIALPCATQNELTEEDAQRLVDNGCTLVAEGANMPCTDEAAAVFESNKVTHVPGKAANAGGVALSGMEMSQNAGFTSFKYQALDEKLQEIMSEIHEQCLHHAPREEQWTNYRKGANIAAFKKISEALHAQGIS